MTSTPSGAVPATSKEGHVPEPKNFAPKVPVQLDAPKHDPFSVAELAACNGTDPAKPTLVAIKGTVFDVSGNKSYMEGGPYRLFAGKDASRALAQSSLKAEDCSPEWEDLPDKEKKVLEEWFVFFSKRYNILGKVV
ncbi:hypothetical protein MMC14_004929 [Varicellaria rhodocarpa]|nr:hypothetical protein [Varicellaria rhodocarpa]